MNDPVSGPDTVCECYHWFEYHRDGGACDDCRTSPNDHTDFTPCQKYVFGPEYNTVSEIIDRGGYPETWPAWMKAKIGPEMMAKILAAAPQEQTRLVRTLRIF